MLIRNRVDRMVDRVGNALPIVVYISACYLVPVWVMCSAIRLIEWLGA